MKQKIFKFIILFVIIAVSMFVGYKLTQNETELVGFSKKVWKISERYYFFTLKKTGLKDFGKKIDEEDVITHKEDLYTKVKGNSFSLIFSKVKSYPGRTASIFLSENKTKEIEYEIFTQDGFIIKKNSILEINFPSLFYSGIRSVFAIDNEYFALGGFVTYSCKYATLFRLRDGKNILKSKCLPDIKNVDYDGLGGAFVKTNDSVLLTIGTPVHSSEKISQLAQSKSSIFGKIISIKNEVLLNYESGEIDYSVLSLGHRNPQGLVQYRDNIFSLEHGPQGGDELNKIIKGGNYGWPVTSFGTRYSDGKSYLKNYSNFSYQEPIFAFLPAVAPSALNVCPENLSNYYKPYNCLMGLSLRERSILIFILDNNNSRVIIFEKINLGGRLRHFGLDKTGKLFVDSKGHFYISMDKDGLYKIKFNNFR
jgi:hypothetical protein|tara:strand:+ start:1420 stop:2688 length:1269 start_codon:yes stop_codon:yes gene_type:complete